MNKTMRNFVPVGLRRERLLNGQLPPDKPNIELDRDATPEDLFAVTEVAREDCGCTPQMREGLEIAGEQVTCLPCAARGVLNGVTTLAERL